MNLPALYIVKEMLLLGAHKLFCLKKKRWLCRKSLADFQENP